jgi:hypothetical protein
MVVCYRTLPLDTTTAGFFLKNLGRDGNDGGSCMESSKLRVLYRYGRT